MKKKSLLIATALLFAGSVAAQLAGPGGVPGPKIWVTSERMADGRTIWSDRLASPPHYFSLTENTAVSPIDHLLNFNAALFFNGENGGLEMPLNELDFSRATFFTVAQSFDTSAEKIVWTLEKNGVGRLALTDYRMADLRSANYMNFLLDRRDQPGLRTYFQYKAPDFENTVQQQLRVGVAPQAPWLPVEAFRGIIPEMIAYDRVLSTQERAQVETYLALKYGLTLPQSNYIDPAGEILWDIRKNADFSTHIAGISREDRSGLYQKQSSSSCEPGLLTLGVSQIATTNERNIGALPDRAFLIWGDNGDSLVLAPKQQGQPQRLRRLWKIAAHGPVQHLSTTLQIDTRNVPSSLAEGEIYWLVIDRSGSGKFPLDATDYYPAPSGQSDQPIFQNLRWDIDDSGSDLFALAVGPPMMAKIWVEPPHCFPPANGTLYIGVEGGRAPYLFDLTGIGINFSAHWQSKTTNVRDVGGLQPGDYQLTVRDAAGLIYQEALYIQSVDAPQSPLANFYWLMPDEPLLLDLSLQSQGTLVNYRWSGPGNFQSTAAQVSIAVPGDYLVSIDSAGCLSRQDIAVRLFQPDNFISISLYPNPAPDGLFHIQARLHRAAALSMQVFDATGRLVSSRTLQGSDHYFFTETLPTAGAYTVVLHSELTQKTLRVLGIR